MIQSIRMAQRCLRAEETNIRAAETCLSALLLGWTPCYACPAEELKTAPTRAVLRFGRRIAFRHAPYASSIFPLRVLYVGVLLQCGATDCAPESSQVEALSR